MKYIKIFVISLLFVTVNYAQTDNIPRERLMTDEELINQLDENIEELSLIKNEFSKDKKDALDKLAEYVKSRNNVKYFFDLDNLKDKLDYFKEIYKSDLDDILSYSDKYLKTYGTDINWKLPTTDKWNRPLTPNSLRFLSRFEPAYKLVLLTVYKSDLSYVKNLLAQLKDFINDYENGKTEIGGNDLFERYYAGHRLRNVLLAYNIMISENYLSNDEVIFFLKFFLLHGARIVDVSKKYHYGNHQTHGLEALLEMTLYFPEFKVNKLWNEIALKTFNEHLRFEVAEDGFQFERASHYFKLELINYFRVYKLYKRNNKELGKIYVQRFRAMFDSIVKLLKPDGELPVLQDAQDIYKSENDSLVNNNEAELPDIKTSDILSIGAEVFKDSNLKYFSSDKIPSLFYWFFTQEEVKNYENLKSSKTVLKSTKLKDTKYYVLRNIDRNVNGYMLIDAGLAKEKPDHTHGGILGIMLNAYGLELLPNYKVKYSEDSTPFLKNSLAKNVALVDYYLQGQTWIDNHARTGFGRWEKLPVPKVISEYFGDNIDYFNATHNGFDTLGVEYTREIFYIKPDIWVIKDNFISEKVHSYQQIFQGNYNIDNDGNTLTKNLEDVSFIIQQADKTNIEFSNHSKFGYKFTTVEKKGVANYTFETLLYPSKGDDKEAKIKNYNNPNYKLIDVKTKDRRLYIFKKKKNKIDIPEIKTDAEYCCILKKNNELKSVLIINGSFLQYEELKFKNDKKITKEFILK